jgi:hypothetical protein
MKQIVQCLFLAVLLSLSSYGKETAIYGPLCFDPKLDGWKIGEPDKQEGSDQVIFRAERRIYIGHDEMAIEVRLHQKKNTTFEKLRQSRLFIVGGGQDYHPHPFGEQRLKISNEEFPAVVAEMPRANDTYSSAFVWIELSDSFLEVFVTCQRTVEDGRAIVLNELKLFRPNQPLQGTPAKAPSSSTEPEGRRP